MQKSSLLCLVIFFSINLLSQDFDHYKPLVCNGELPSEITSRTSETIADGIDQVKNNSDSYATAKTKSEFILKSNYMINELLTGGTILFGDDVTTYVNRIADKILEKDPVLRSKLSFYCLKSNLSNAFTTHQGYIFVTLGLISQLENEAQLAFVIAHEITHYKRKHVINTVLESDRTFKKKRGGKTVSFDANIIKLSNYSKTLELESDSTGFYYLKNAGYDLKSALTIFDVLQYSRLPFDEVSFDVTRFDTKYYAVPEEWILDTLMPINLEVDEDDERSTHPNLNKRRSKIKLLLKNASSGGVDNFFTTAKFKSIRDICRFETIRINLQNADYIKALYNINVLQKFYPKSFYLKNAYFKAMYGISVYSLTNNLYDISDDYMEYEGEISALYYFIENVALEDFTLMALRVGWELYNETKDPFVKQRLADLISLANKKNELDYDELSVSLTSPLVTKTIEDTLQTKGVEDTLSKNIFEGKEDVAKDSQEEIIGETKYEKLRRLQEESNGGVVEIEEEGVVVTKKVSKLDMLRDVKNLEGLLTFVEQNKSYPDDDAKWYEYSRKERKKIKKYENAIAAEKIILVDPEYYAIDESKGGVKLINSEDSKYELYDQIAKVAKLSKIETEILSPKTLRAADVAIYNDISKMNYWTSEILLHEKSKLNWDMVISEAEYLKEFTTTYNTDYFGYTGVMVYKAKQEGVVGRVLIGLILPYYLPYALYDALTPEYYSYYYTAVYDIKQGKRVVTYINSLNYKARKSNINSMMYDLYLQMKQEPYNSKTK